MADAINFEDPCAVAAALKKARNELALGMRASRVRFRQGDVEREVEFSQAKMSDLLAALREAEAECDALTASAPRRFAIGSGFRPWRF